jgi:hypothetical protein
MMSLKDVERALTKLADLGLVESHQRDDGQIEWALTARGKRARAEDFLVDDPPVHDAAC